MGRKKKHGSDDEWGGDDGDSEPTYPCKHCGRTFVKRALEKHEKAKLCQKGTNRKPFDSVKQRVKGSDITEKSARKAQKEFAESGGRFAPPKTHWKEKHNDHQQSIKAGKQVDKAIKEGKPLPKISHRSSKKDGVECEYCGRTFNDEAAERHIPFCKKKHGKENSVSRSRKTASSHRSSSRGGSGGKSRHGSGSKRRGSGSKSGTKKSSSSSRRRSGSRRR